MNQKLDEKQDLGQKAAECNEKFNKIYNIPKLCMNYITKCRKSKQLSLIIELAKILMQVNLF